MKAKRQGRRTGAGAWPGRLGAALAAVLVLATPLLAEAQERRSLLELLFGRRKAPEATNFPPPPPPPVRRKRSAAPAPGASRPAAAPVPAPVEKRADASRILVIGDFLANGLGDGLEEAFTDAPGVSIITRPNGSSGLVRDDHYDWLRQLPLLLDEVKPAAAIVMLGSNDRQQLPVGETRERFGTEAWMAEYRRRTAALATIVTARKIPLVWVGLPPFQSPSLTADALTLNRALRAEAEKAGGSFIDIWDGFADEDGKFVTTGSDINGKPVRLRGTDGIGLTKAGKRKLAFYLEKPVRNLLGEEAEVEPVTTAPGDIRLGTENLPALLSLSPSRQEIPVRTPPLAMDDPGLDGGDELLGARAIPARHVLSPRDRLVERGELAPAPSGRADSDRLDTP